MVERIVEAFRERGRRLPGTPRRRSASSGPGRDPADYEQVNDIVDVWFESGSTHAFTLEDRQLPWPADLYLEGSDQHRGWFHSSLLEAVGTRGRAPFKAVLTHGFVLDEQGRKMSKSLGNVIAPQQVWDKYGADILRLWVMMSDTAEDLRIGPEILKQQAELYRRLRNTLRWLLGSLDGFSEAERVAEAEMPELERWVLHRLAELDARVRARRAPRTTGPACIRPCTAFCAVDLSAFYFDIRKDAVYCDRPDSLRRRAARTVLDHLHRCLATWLAPVLVFTAEEAWVARFGEAASVHLEDFPAVPVPLAGRGSGAAVGGNPGSSAGHHRRRRACPPQRGHRLVAGDAGRACRARRAIACSTKPNGRRLPSFPRSASSTAPRMRGRRRRSSAPRGANAPAAGRCWRRSARTATIRRSAAAAWTRSNPASFARHEPHYPGRRSLRPSPRGRDREAGSKAPVPCPASPVPPSPCSCWPPTREQGLDRARAAPARDAAACGSCRC